jgi:hypothetical protein
MKGNLKAWTMNKDLMLSFFMILFSLVLIFWLTPNFVASDTSGSHGLSPRFFPYTIATVLLTLSIMLLVNTYRKSASEKSDDDSIAPDRFTLYCIGFLFLLYFAIQLIGMIPSCFLALMVLIRMFCYKNKVVIVTFSAVFIFVLFAFFELVAQIPMPRGIFFE